MFVEYKKINIPRLFVLVLSFFFFQINNLNAEETTTIQDRFFYGYCIHFGLNNRPAYDEVSVIENYLHQLGANATRDNLSWEILNLSSLDTPNEKMADLAYSLKNIKAKPMVILGSHSRFLPEGQPHTEKSRRAYARYAKYTARILYEENPIYEIWNEWDRGVFEDSSLGSAEAYLELVKSTVPEIRKVNEDNIIIGGGAGGDNHWEWTRKAVSLGLMDYVDGLSIHPYNYCAKHPDNRTGTSVIRWVEVLQSYLKKITGGKAVPIYITEIGWPEGDDKCTPFSEQEAADNVAQMLLEAPVFPWLKGIWFYELMDEGTDPGNREHHFGFYHLDKTPKPSACVAETVWDFIADTTSVKRSRKIQGLVRMSYTAPDKRQRIALWSARKLKPLQIWVSLPPSAEIKQLCSVRLLTDGEWIKINSTPLLVEVPEKDAHLITFR